MSRFAALDLSQVPVPDIVDALDFETILTEIKTDFVQRFPAYNVDALESDPVVKVLEVAAARELVVRARVNDAARAIMLARAHKGDLDNLGALYRTRRLITGTVEGGNEPIYENDTEFRRRISLAPEAFSSAGPEGAYIYFALTGDGETRIATDASAERTEPGYVTVYIMGEDGEPDAFEIDAVRNVFDADDKTPMTDHVTVSGGKAENFNVVGVLEMPPGPDSDTMVAKSIEGIEAYAAQRRRLGGEITISGLTHAGFVDGARALRLSEPFENIIGKKSHFPNLDNLIITAEIK